MRKSFKNIIVVGIINVLAIILAILILSILHLAIGMTVAKIDGNDIQLTEAIVFCLRTNTKLVLVGLAVISCIYSVRKFIRTELDALEN